MGYAACETTHCLRRFPELQLNILGSKLVLLPDSLGQDQNGATHCNDGAHGGGGS